MVFGSNNEDGIFTINHAEQIYNIEKDWSIVLKRSEL